MRRRQFIMCLCAAAGWAWPQLVFAQLTDRVRRVGVMLVTAENDPEGQARLGAFRETLRDLGWIEGRNLELVPRWVGGNAIRARTVAMELLAISPDVVLTTALATRAVQPETTTVPIVFVQVIDPVEQGIVQSLARPGGNTTGFTHFEPAMGGKWLGMLKEMAPHIDRVAFLYNPDSAARGSGSASFVQSFETYAATAAVTPVKLAARDDAELRRGMELFRSAGGGGLLVPPDLFNTLHRDTIVNEAVRHRLPTIFPYRFYTVSGGLMSYGVDLYDLYRRAAGYVDRILKGEKPAEMPVQTPSKFELVINIKTANAIGLTIPPTLLARADEVIE